MKLKEHWESVYSTKPTDGVSWFQVHDDQSLRLVKGIAVSLSAAIIDVGGRAALTLSMLRTRVAV
jgi:hypothetical protein